MEGVGAAGKTGGGAVPERSPTSGGGREATAAGGGAWSGFPGAGRRKEAGVTSKEGPNPGSLWDGVAGNTETWGDPRTEGPVRLA